MNKKIKELKERVRLTDEEVEAAWDSIPLYTEDDVGRKFAIAKAQLNKVLEDKDLYLIDQTCYTYPETGKKLAYVIPLADALGEREC